MKNKLMQRIINILHKTEKMIASMKFAVTLISLFILAMIAGTFIESIYGTDFANRMIYKSVPFMVLQGFLFLSILLATLFRIPFKSRLTGFYITHLGLIILFIGSFVTYIAGIDGIITLVPGETSRELLMTNVDQFYLHDSNKNITYQTELPYNFKATTLNDQLQEIQLIKYLPYSKFTTQWEQDTNKQYQSSQYYLYNDNLNQAIILSSHPQSSYPRQKKLGPLNVQYYPVYLYPCFGTGAFIWNSLNRTCTPLEAIPNVTSSQHNGSQIFTVSIDNKNYKFSPELSTYPLENTLPDKNSAIRLFNPDLFLQHKILFLFGDKAAYPQDGKWAKSILSAKTPIDLPWMGFQLVLQKNASNSFPIKVPIAAYPAQKDGKIINGVKKAIQFKIKGSARTYWVSQGQAQNISIQGQPFIVAIGSKKIHIPFELTLNKFTMKKSPGTDRPASFESFIQIFAAEGISKHHIYMNNPLKKDKLTFYQSSYFKTDAGDYGSVLSVNYDPGRWAKYLGSLLLVLGAFIHFFMKRKKKTKKISKKTSTHKKFKRYQAVLEGV